MMGCDDQLDNDARYIIAENLGENWRNVFRGFGYSNGRIEQMFVNYIAEGLAEVIYQLLLDWNEKNENATLGCISILLWKEHREVVVLLKQWWKVNHQRNGQ